MRAIQTEEATIANHSFEEFESKTKYFEQNDCSVWSQNGVDVALYSLEKIQVSFIRAAELLRDSDTADAHCYFAQCIEGLQRFLEAIRNTRTALSLDFKGVSTEFGSLADTESNLLGILKAMFLNQNRKEYEQLADRIEYELLTNLSSWNAGLQKIRREATQF